MPPRPNRGNPSKATGCAPIGPAAPAPAAPEPPARKAAYAGLGLRSNPEGVVVVGVQPGPFGGDGSKSPSIWRGDLIVSMNGQSLDLAGYIRLIRSLSPGDTLEVMYRRGPECRPQRSGPARRSQRGAAPRGSHTRRRGELERDARARTWITESHRPRTGGRVRRAAPEQSRGAWASQSPRRTGRAGCVSGFLAAAAAGSQLGARGRACARAATLARSGRGGHRRAGAPACAAAAAAGHPPGASPVHSAGPRS